MDDQKSFDALLNEIAAFRKVAIAICKDADRYIWLLAHMGLIEEEAAKWNPKKDRPLLKHLQDFIDREMQKAGEGWIEKQRTLLNKPD